LTAKKRGMQGVQVQVYKGQTLLSCSHARRKKHVLKVKTGKRIKRIVEWRKRQRKGGETLLSGGHYHHNIGQYGPTQFHVGGVLGG